MPVTVTREPLWGGPHEKDVGFGGSILGALYSWKLPYLSTVDAEDPKTTCYAFLFGTCTSMRSSVVHD